MTDVARDTKLCYNDPQMRMGENAFMDKRRLEAQLAEFPICDYAFFTTDELVFTDRVRYICEHECPMYNATWACPPAVGSVEKCRTRVLAYHEGLMITTAAQVPDINDMEQTLSTRGMHEQVTRDVLACVRQQSSETLTLSTEACAQCEACTWPNAPCRHPDRMFPCVESHGILVSDLAERHGIEFCAGNGIVTWFSLIFYR